ncbi:hypothetical protein A3H38_06515 [candidate division WOR-1 bacterium RIFCSPLOWO2_02_FULL_46_20]|uniref:Nitroreductase domain-containing protein n=2 Tax=Saganbacteria TaxID=1703751 RepID=A0A1F4RCD2_UNCSA|nr:MAG: hypothetical protein A3J44_03410 [candidate division WOR-1 bacterium RIFCSPHIGHO2_02_FULL_45_12]OGC05839.1 MAG: hypothetical protein A3H38_06515 [candidate division WOR-1 bacterium RIFCSPLOWO2_02_FULL_46_20]OGC09118.1 MAG: hypothetical protein A3F86_01415 [candidate division WOR-1 bacterium RIFCSPLOWO2_12_FULL_45_9]
MPRRIFSIILLVFFLSGNSLAVKTINLPTPQTIGKVSLEQSIGLRRSEREFYEKELTQQQLSQLLWAAQGITDKDFGFRAAPSAGALYPLSIYVANKDGVFHYIPDGHKLIEISSEDKRPSLVRASLGQDCIRVAPVTIVIAANFIITQAKYGVRAFRYVCIEVGHVAENIHLQAIALGLGSSPLGAFWDDVVKTTLEIPENQETLYIIPVGYVKK